MTQLDKNDPFQSLLNWKLKRGSHEFPGFDGGTCINEAAVVAAGFEYQQVEGAEDMPPCFSPVISAYALELNDRMPARIRQKLLVPFVMRLANTNDSVEVEDARANLIINRTITLIVGSIIRDGIVVNRLNIDELLHKGLKTAKDEDALHEALMIRHMIASVEMIFPRQREYCYLNMKPCGKLVATVGEYWHEPMKFYRLAVSLLDEAILLGNHNPIEICAGAKRMDAVRANAKTESDAGGGDDVLVGGAV